MEKEPYYYPPRFYKECSDAERKRIFRKQYPEHDCIQDPFYPERIDIYRAIKQDFETKVHFDKEDEKQNWKNSMQKVYQDFDIKTPYNFYTDFIRDVSYILNSNKKNKGEILYVYVAKTYQNYFRTDPFYTFYSILDFLLYELFFGKHEHDQDSKKLPISNDDLVKFIYLLIVNSFVGITQFRFIIYMSVLYKNVDSMRLLLGLIDFLDIPLTKNIGSNSLKVKVFKRLLLTDALEFSYLQLKFKIVDFLVQECGVPLSNLNPRVLKALHNRDELRNVYANFDADESRLVKKYYFDLRVE